MQLHSSSLCVISRVDRLVGEWQRLEHEAQEGIRSPPGAEDLDRLSLKHNVLDGKWLITGVPSNEIDNVWAAIASLYACTLLTFLIRRM
ncbi:hypothetical protein DUNSADRAFT_3540 [Dunaliella salina]|uniref:Uncharacterized protein n=1 Tax=Dunaliella salina TaxID=3046 RepID=A0ABQ7H7W3_DUNSA|nr:hypothetical protein DUNSADRAFT_3540 [Dunaliella salina]|eukprot:KAF5842947.1 hypothetical protein DUNSADRAFT_3540 [Dunaliella salina]